MAIAMMMLAVTGCNDKMNMPSEVSSIKITSKDIVKEITSEEYGG